MASFQAKIDLGSERKRENKNCRSVPFRSYPMRNRKFQTNSKKIKTYHYSFFSIQNTFEKAKKEGK